MFLLLRVCTLVCFLIPALASATTLENPQPDSFQSGIGVISGWVCDASHIEIEFNNDAANRWQAGYGTRRTDTQGVCGDTDNGFGLLYNWNKLGDGVHTVRVFADGSEFAQASVIVTTLGAEFRTDIGGEFPISDFPTAGTDSVLRWQEAQQNFVITDGSTGSGGGTSGAPPNVLENPPPGSFQSGIGIISGWVCDANRIEIEFNNDTANRWQAGYPTRRTDTQSVCGDTDNGFGLLFNWNKLGDGVHTVRVFADGNEFAHARVTVTTLGAEFRTGLSQAMTLPDFPEAGTDSVVVWQEAQQNFVLSSAAPTIRTVTVQPTLSLPPGVSVPNVEVTSLLSDTTVTVQAGPEPSLLLATDADGTVLLSVADMDGGFLGEGQGKVDVSINSTAVTLVALAAGYRISDIDQGLVDQITAHAQYPALLTALTQGLQADKNFLDRIMADTETVRLIRLVAGVRTESTPQLAAQRRAAREPVLPNGVVQTNFWAGSPWKDGEPWTWFGETKTGLLTAFLPTPPFLAVSAGSSHATGNPNFVDYALEVYHNGSFQDWYYVPGNGSRIDKGLNSGAALSGFSVPTPTPYSGPPLDRVRFARYRLDEDSSRASALSFMNTTKLLMATGGVILPTGLLTTPLKKLNVKKYHKALAACGATLATAVALPSGTSSSARTVVDWFVANMGSGFQAVADCFKKPELGQAFRGDPVGLARTILGWGGTLGKWRFKWGTGYVGWLLIAFDAANEAKPAFTSYVAPGAGSVDYYLNWDMDGSPALERVSESPLPPAPTNLRVESSTDTSVTLAWDGGQGRYRVYRWESEWKRVLADTGTARTQTVGGLRAGDRHCFTVVSVDSQGMESLDGRSVCVGSIVKEHCLLEYGAEYSSYPIYMGGHGLFGVDGLPRNCTEAARLNAGAPLIGVFPDAWTTVREAVRRLRATGIWPSCYVRDWAGGRAYPPFPLPTTIKLPSHRIGQIYCEMAVQSDSLRCEWFKEAQQKVEWGLRALGEVDWGGRGLPGPATYCRP